MSLILKSLPLAAIGLVLIANKDALQKNLNIVEKVRVATTASIEIKSIAESVYMEWIDSDTLPLENSSGFLRENMEEAKGGNKRDRASDMWGTPYRMARVRTGFEIRYAGPDKKWNTLDDISFFRNLHCVPDVGGAARRQSPTAASSGMTGTGTGTRSATGAPKPQPKPSSHATKQKVVEFQRKRAAEGSASAQYDLGLRHLNGDGVEKDEAAARSWLQKAAAGGNSQAVKKLKELDASSKLP